MANVFTNLQQNIGTREFISQMTGTFDSILQEVASEKVVSASTVRNVFWSINSAGTITLAWDMTTGNDVPFLILSGNGRWELGKSEYKAPEGANGKIVITTSGFIATDTYSLNISGKK